MSIPEKGETFPDNAELKVIRKEDLKPGDIVILSIPKIISQNAHAHCKRLLRASFPDNNHIILAEGAKISIVSEMTQAQILSEDVILKCPFCKALDEYPPDKEKYECTKCKIIFNEDEANRF